MSHPLLSYVFTTPFRQSLVILAVAYCVGLLTLTLFGFRVSFFDESALGLLIITVYFLSIAFIYKRIAINLERGRGVGLAFLYLLVTLPITALLILVGAGWIAEQLWIDEAGLFILGMFFILALIGFFCFILGLFLIYFTKRKSVQGKSGAW